MKSKWNIIKKLTIQQKNRKIKYHQIIIEFTRKKMPSSPQHLDYELMNIDYNNIHDSFELQKIIHELKSIIEHKISHINKLTSMHDKQQQERQIILRRMNQTNENNFKKIQEYKALIFAISEAYSKFCKDSDEEKDKQKKNIQATHQLQLAQIVKRIQELQAEYKKVKQVEEIQAEYVARIDNLKKQIIAKQYQHNDGMNIEQFQQMKQNRELQVTLSQQVTSTMKSAPAQAITKITSQIHSNEEQNFQLKKKLFQLQSQLQKLKKDRNQILTKRKQLKINVTLNQEELQEYKAVGSLQKAKIKAYKDKLDNLKILIAEQVAKKQKSLADHKKQRQATLKTLKLKLFNLEKEKQELKLKMEKINLLAQTILQQRTSVEQFFVMALDGCKKQIQEQMTPGRKGIERKDQQEKTYGDKVDIDELLPKDKQRILTNLYTKLAFGNK